MAAQLRAHLVVMLRHLTSILLLQHFSSHSRIELGKAGAHGGLACRRHTEPLLGSPCPAVFSRIALEFDATLPNL